VLLREGLAALAGGDALHPLQEAFIRHDAFQCGYCTPGQLCSAAGLIAEGEAKSIDDVRELMSGNVCRCGAYVQIRQAVVPNGRPAITDFRVVDRRAGHALIEAYPRSGRLHQIRAHLSHLGLPMVGDKIYGRDPQAFLDFMETGQTPELTARLGLPRQALQQSTMPTGQWMCRQATRSTCIPAAHRLCLQWSTRPLIVLATPPHQ
jgi:hypothetical protein